MCIKNIKQELSALARTNGKKVKMPILSKIRTTASAGGRLAQGLVRAGQTTQIAVRSMGGHNMVKRPSSFSKYQVRDDVTYFLALAAVPLGLFIGYTNITIGPAKLVDTPDDYIPETHEYYRLPITRLLAKYGMDSYEKSHERTLYYLHKADEKRKNKQRQAKIKALQKEKPDHKGWYYVPAQGQLHEKISTYQSDDIQQAIDLKK